MCLFFIFEIRIHSQEVAKVVQRGPALSPSNFPQGNSSRKCHTCRNQEADGDAVYTPSRVLSHHFSHVLVCVHARTCASMCYDHVHRCVQPAQGSWFLFHCRTFIRETIKKKNGDNRCSPTAGETHLCQTHLGEFPFTVLCIFPCASSSLFSSTHDVRVLVTI